MGGGLSGLAAAIRLARFIPHVVLLEQHSRIGGLNSYYYRSQTLLETGLHAITNYAEPDDRRAPLNRLLRQLKLRRSQFAFFQQKTSEILFQDRASIVFSNDFGLLEQEIATKFPGAADGFRRLCRFVADFDPFQPAPFRSARAFLEDILGDTLLTEMLLCPLMYYGSSVEDDMDLSQFAIMFQAIYQEGFFRPATTIKDFLDLLLAHYQQLGGSIRLGCRVASILHEKKQVRGVKLETGEIIECDFLLSTIGYEETLAILDLPCPEERSGRLGFVESIFQMPAADRMLLPDDRTVIFYNTAPSFCYRRPAGRVDLRSGVICLPFNFAQRDPGEFIEVRSTHLASYARWRELGDSGEKYQAAKAAIRSSSKEILKKFLGNFDENIVYEDTFTPLTIERYTAKKHGAIYGSPRKIKDGDLGFTNLFLAGTDQGFLGIIGAMLSGVSIVNQHILPKL